jgi:hypothetical protein
MAFHNRKLCELASVEMANGNVLQCFSSDGVIPQGFNVDLAWIDEDVEQEGWIDEIQARTADAKGYNRSGQMIDGGVLCWSAMPHSKNEALVSLWERAEAEQGTPNPRVVGFRWEFGENVHVSVKERDETMKDWAARGDDVLRMRAYGDFTMNSVRMYPSFHKDVHGLTRAQLYQLCRSDTDPEKGELDEPPGDWCRFMTVDPGHNPCSVLFGAIAPPHIERKYGGELALVYDELTIHESTASLFGKQVAAKVRGYGFRAFIIDEHGGRLTDFGSGLRPMDQYSASLRENGVRSELTGHHFLPGTTDKQARADALRVWMWSDLTQKPKLRYMHEKCRMFEKSVKGFRKKTIRVGGATHVTDEPQTRGNTHLAQTAEYWAASKPVYSTPRKAKVLGSARARLMEKRKKKNRNRNTLVLAPGS